MRYVLLFLLCLGKAHAACDVPLRIPPEFQTAQFDLNKIRVVDRDIPINPHVTSGYIQPIREFRSTVEKLSGDLHSVLGTFLTKIDVVFYPFSGSDILTPLLLFPHASVFMAVDEHYFILDRSKDTTLVINPSRPFVGAWRGTDGIDSEKIVGARLIESLYAGFPQSRIYQILVFSNPHGKVDFRNSALIEFDLGPGTPRRYWIQIAETLFNRTPLQERWWGAQLRDRGVMAVMVKGAWGCGSHQLCPSPRKTEPNALRNSLLSHLVESKGVLIEGTGEVKNDARAGEVAGKLSRLGFRPYRHGKTWLFSSKGFGYRDRVLATRFFQFPPLWPLRIKQVTPTENP